MSNPLVSIIVITYNSSKYVLETLESAKAQTYQNIELIVSDDSSTDNTVDICRNWIEKNKERFVQTKLVTVEHNTGIPANCNRGVKVANGEWVKLIAGDDALLPNCILSNLEYLKNNEDVEIIHSISNKFLNYFISDNLIGQINFSNKLITHDKISAEEQYQILLRGCWINTPTVFMKKSLLSTSDNFDESIPYVEDWPFFLKITTNGKKIFFMNELTVNYRIHSESVYQKTDMSLINSDFYKKVRPVYKKYIFENIPQFERAIENFEYYRIKTVISLGLNKNNLINHFIDRITMQIRHRYRYWVLNQITDQIERRINKK